MQADSHDISLVKSIIVQIRLQSVGALKNAEVHHFDNNGFKSPETLNYIISSGIWGPTRHLSLKITNSLAILRLRKHYKPQPGWSVTGFEPGTLRMRVSCFTTEPPRSVIFVCYTHVMF